MTRKHTKSFDLFSAYNCYLPQWRGMIILALLLLAGSCIGSLITLILSLIFKSGVMNDYTLLISYPIQFIPAMIYAASKSHANEMFDNNGIALDEGRFAPIGGLWLAIMVAVGTIACAIVCEPITLLLPEMPEFMKNLMETIAGGPLWASLLATAVFAPFFEEWLCRGIVLRGMLQKYSPTVAIVISAAFFAIIHLNPWQALPAFILGCLFGLVYYKTGSLKLTMLMHCANNAFSVLLSRLPGADDCDTMYQFFDDKVLYGIIYAASAALLFLLVYRFIKTDFKNI